MPRRAMEGRLSESRPVEAMMATQRKKNPFLNREQSILPIIPEHPDWSFLWMRVELGGGDDGSNVVAHINGHLSYDYVRPADLIQMFGGKFDLTPLQAKAGTYEGFIKVRDCVLMKAPKEMRDLYLEACDDETESLAGQLKDRVQGQISDSRVKLTYEDRETRGRVVSVDEDE